MFRGGYTAFAVLAALVVVAASLPRGPLVVALRVTPLVALGRISYGLYLWHWPIDLWLDPEQVGVRGWPLFAIRTVVALAAATLSFVVLERPIRERRSPLARPVPAGIALAAVTIGVLAAGLGARSETLVADAAARPLAIDPSSFDGASARERSATTTGEARGGGGEPAGPIRITLIGDSVGWSLSQWVGDPADADLSHGALIGCGIDPAPLHSNGRAVPMKGGNALPCANSAVYWDEVVRRTDPDVVVVVMGAWGSATATSPTSGTSWSARMRGGGGLSERPTRSRRACRLPHPTPRSRSSRCRASPTRIGACASRQALPRTRRGSRR
jgi:hypothetical protein